MLSSIRLSWTVRARLSSARFRIYMDGLRPFSIDWGKGKDDKDEELSVRTRDSLPVANKGAAGLDKTNSEALVSERESVAGYSFDELLDRIAAAQLRRDERIFHDQPAEVPQRRKRHLHRTLDNIDELVQFLREENARDVCVIRVPPEREYVEHFVVCSGLGTRHIHTMADNLAAEVKRCRDGKGRRVRVDGKESSDWTAVDVGFAVVHMMLDDTRQRYELEKLWTLGPKYDDQTISMLADRPSPPF